MSKQSFMGWEINTWDMMSSPVADNGRIYISDGYDSDTLSIEGIGYDNQPVSFHVPIAVMRAWLQEYEKWKAHNDSRPMP